MNVIVLLLDTLRRDFLGYHGNDVIQTPALDALARMGTVFDRAYLGSYPCMPARRDLWTGRYEFPWRGWGPLEDNDNPLPDQATASGHRTALITDHFHLWERGAGNYHMGFECVQFIRGQEKDAWIQDDRIAIRWPAAPEKLAGHLKRPREGFEQYVRNTAHFRNEEDYFGPQVMRHAINWLEGNHTAGDFLLVVDNFDPHEPFDAPEPYRSMYNPAHGEERIIWPTYGKSDLPPEDLNDIRALYAGLVTMTDRWVGLLLEKVKQLGLLTNTAIILMTDHGHLLGEHGLLGKPWAGLADSNLYRELVHVPLMIYHPDAQPKRILSFVQTVDLHPTILDLLGIAYQPERLHGRSLLPFVLEGTEPSDWKQSVVYGRYGEAVNITDRDWTLMQWHDARSGVPAYWYSHQAPRFSENVRQIGELEDNRRFRVQVTRGISETSLYHDAQDPGQAMNLAFTPTHSDKLQRLRQQLSNFLHEIDAPPEMFDRYMI